MGEAKRPVGEPDEAAAKRPGMEEAYDLLLLWQARGIGLMLRYVRVCGLVMCLVSATVLVLGIGSVLRGEGLEPLIALISFPAGVALSWGATIALKHYRRVFNLPQEPVAADEQGAAR